MLIVYRRRMENIFFTACLILFTWWGCNGKTQVQANPDQDSTCEISSLNLLNPFVMFET